VRYVAHGLTATGERYLAMELLSGVTLADRLGAGPLGVRESLARLSVPGYKVCRWERHWEDEGAPFKDPVEVPQWRRQWALWRQSRRSDLG